MMSSVKSRRVSRTLAESPSSPHQVTGCDGGETSSGRRRAGVLVRLVSDPPTARQNLHTRPDTSTRTGAHARRSRAC
jgi:hypothetical protein